MGRPDFALVHADDFVLDELGGRVAPNTWGDALLELLLSWRQDVDAEPIVMARLDHALGERADTQLQRGA